MGGIALMRQPDYIHELLEVIENEEQCGRIFCGRDGVGPAGDGDRPMKMIKIANWDRGGSVKLVTASLLATLFLGSVSVLAQRRDDSGPLEPEQSIADAEADERAVNDSTTDMETRLSKQIMLLQRQINQLARRIEAMELGSAD